MVYREIDSELDAHRDWVQWYMIEQGITAAEVYATCPKLEEWRLRLQARPDLLMRDFALWVWEMIQDGSWEQSWSSGLFHCMGKNMPPKLQEAALGGMPPRSAARIICLGEGAVYFTPEELTMWKPKLDGVYYDHPGRHFIDEIV